MKNLAVRYRELLMLAVLLFSNVTSSYAGDGLINPVPPIDEFDVTGVLLKMNAQMLWLEEKLREPMADTRALLKEYDQRKENVLSEALEKRRQEWANEQYLLSVNKCIRASRPNAKNPFRTPSRNTASGKAVCSMESEIWMPDGVGVISSVETSGGGNGSNRYYSPEPIQVETGCYVEMRVTSGHWDDFSTGHCGLCITLTQRYRHSTEFIDRKFTEDFDTVSKMIQSSMIREL